MRGTTINILYGLLCYTPSDSEMLLIKYKTVIQELYKFGAKKIHVRIPSPKIINKCSLGIDIPSCEELLAFNRNNHEIAKELKVSTINYLDYDDLDKIFDRFLYSRGSWNELQYFKNI